MNTSAPFLGSVLAVAVGIVACEANDGSAGARSQLQAEPTTKPRNDMKIHLRIQDEVLSATLRDTPTARDFASMLPLTLTLQDYAKTEKVGDLPRKLKTQGSPAGADPSVGDIAYYAPWGNLALYYKDFGYSDGLILLGKLDGGVEALAAPGSVKVTIERAAE
jgi:hypothetical protein